MIPTEFHLYNNDTDYKDWHLYQSGNHRDRWIVTFNCEDGTFYGVFNSSDTDDGAFENISRDLTKAELTLALALIIAG